MSEPREYLLRVRNDRLELGYLAGDVLTVREQDAAETGQIVIAADSDGNSTVTRWDGTGRVLGLVLEMHRRVSNTDRSAS